MARDGTAELFSQDQILRRERGSMWEKIIFPVELATSRIGHHRLTHTLQKVLTIHTVQTVVVVVVERKIRTRLDLLSIPQSGGKKMSKRLGGIKEKAANTKPLHGI